MRAQQSLQLLAALTACIGALAQSSTRCNPLFADCPPAPAFEDTYVADFTKGPNPIFPQLDGRLGILRGSVSYNRSDGLILAISRDKQYPTLVSTKYVFFGRVDVEMRAARGKGIISSFVLQSADLDEIDWEFIGSRPDEVQTNYFSKGNTSDWSRGETHDIPPALPSAPSRSGADDFTAYHTYSVDWSPEQINFLIDNEVVRTVTYEQALSSSGYPQTPVQVRVGAWQAGYDGNNAGTIEWAGGVANFSQAPFIACVRTIRISNRSNGVAGAKQYVYGDRSGTMGSIVVETDDDGDDSGDDSDDSGSDSDDSSGSSGTGNDSGSDSDGDGETRSSSATGSVSSSLTSGTPGSTPVMVPLLTLNAGAPATTTITAANGLTVEGGGLPTGTPVMKVGLDDARPITTKQGSGGSSAGSASVLLSIAVAIAILGVA